MFVVVDIGVVQFSLMGEFFLGNVVSQVNVVKMFVKDFFRVEGGFMLYYNLIVVVLLIMGLQILSYVFVIGLIYRLFSRVFFMVLFSNGGMVFFICWYLVLCFL